ncbi:Uncharacterised protein [BD1-7 clade bacterium]|uniref:Sulfotransferase domain-containing protein n=1 Tax=BD1-7 clade bacterium TaxID=2029982 RepID=A0A5S9QQP6_9GAMM|nr:Uncharacterised protein [BD1-7 clade bacterium]CAA0121453.1 Uncharacterised protein [BD1-7 clade bacterium]
MATELHLHLGAHKTASTHLQEVLMANSGDQDDFTYIDTPSFRQNYTRANRFVDDRCSTQTNTYLDALGQLEPKRLLISEENIIGQPKEIFDCQHLYPSAAERLGKLSGFVAGFENSTIWLSIRSMDTFLPSFYCEYLRHKPYKPFDQVLEGQYQQSWVPLIKLVAEAFPNSQINIVCYEKYRYVLPLWLEKMTDSCDTQQWNLLSDKRPRSSHSQFAIHVARLINPVIGSHRIAQVIDWISTVSFRYAATGRKFSPFDTPTKRALQDQYRDDLNRIPSMGDNIGLFNVPRPIGALSKSEKLQRNGVTDVVTHITPHATENVDA